MAKSIVKVRENVFHSIDNVVFALEDLIESLLEDCPAAKPVVTPMLRELRNGWYVDLDESTSHIWYKVDLDKLSRTAALVTDIKTQIGK